MTDLKLIQILKDKYNVPINNIDGIQMCHMQLVINTIREYDNELLKTAYDKLQNSSNSYDDGCNIIRKILNK